MNKKGLIGIIVGIVAFVFIIVAVVLGVTIASKINCKHDNAYEIELLPYKAATCQETGLTWGKKCNYCGEILIEQKIIPITSCNQNITLPRKSPSCKATGLSEGKKCSVCDKIVVPQTTLSKLTCQESSWIVDVKATKTTDGSRHTECTMCGKVMKTQVVAAGSQNLTYREQDDGTYYVSTCSQYSDPNVVIPRMYNGQNVTGINYYTFQFNKKLESIIIPDTVKYIGASAFSKCENLKTVKLPEKMLAIDSYAFKDCLSLISIDLPYGIENINLYTFYGCESLKRVTIPSTVTKIYGYAFGGCSSLTDIEFEGTVEEWNSINKSDYWNIHVPATEVKCSNGTVSLK